MVNLIEMEFSHDLVNIVQFLNREVLEPWVFSSLAIDRQKYMFILKLMELKHIFKRVEWLFGCYLCFRTHADPMKFISFIVCVAFWLTWVHTIILVVRHLIQTRYLAAEIVLSINADIEKGFSLLQKVFAYNITSISSPSVSESLKRAVSILL